MSDIGVSGRSRWMVVLTTSTGTEVLPGQRVELMQFPGAKVRRTSVFGRDTRTAGWRNLFPVKHTWRLFSRLMLGTC